MAAASFARETAVPNPVVLLPPVRSSPRPPIISGRIRWPRSPRTRPRTLSGPVLPTDRPAFSWLAQRLAPGEATFVVGTGSSVDRFLSMVFAGSALVGGRVSLLEGANRFDPYEVADAGRGFGLDPEEYLERIRLARAFTAYQMVALADAWAYEARRHRASLLVAHEVPELFHATELPAEERVPLLRHVSQALRAATESTRRPLLVTCRRGFEGFPGFTELGPRLKELLFLTESPGTLSAEGFGAWGRLALVSRPPGQRGLEEFAPPDEKEVTVWDGRFRRTAKRSKRG